MPITVITGKPRNGKTLRMNWMLLQESKKKNPRPIFAAGIDGLQPGYATVLEDVTRWNEQDGNGNYLVPDGSIIFVDEAWKWFGHLSNARGQITPPHVLAMAEHGHRALDFVFTTQGPGQLYPFLRPLIADHYHCVRAMGLQACNIYEWPELQDDPKSNATRAIAQKTLWPYPKDIYPMYKSASGHDNIKPKLPLKLVWIPLGLLIGVGLLYSAYAMLKPDAMAANLTSSTATPGLPGAPATSEAATTTPGNISHTTAESYADALMPKVPQMPWTAPAFEGREVTAEPEVYCMAGGSGEGGNGWQGASVTCITEQGTRYVMDAAAARKLATDGPDYNPYRVKPEPAQRSLQGSASQPARQAAPAPVVGIGEPGEPPHASGEFRG